MGSVREYVVAIGLTALLAAGCGGSGSDAPPPVTVTPTAGEGQRLALPDIRSTQTGADYFVNVYLPPDYANSNEAYPVIYALAGDPAFAQFADVLDEKQKPVVLVAFNNVDVSQREQDRTLPGAREFFDFITLELLPWAESQYRIDPAQRTLAGHSLGGLFAGLALLLEEPGNRYFESILSSDGSFGIHSWRTIGLEEQLSQTTSSLPVRLVLGAATAGNVLAVRGYKDMMLARGYEDLDLQYLVFVTTHEEVYYLSFRRGMDELFPATD